MARTRDGRGSHEAADGRERSCRSRLWPRASLASSNYFAVFLLLCNFTPNFYCIRAVKSISALTAPVRRSGLKLVLGLKWYLLLAPIATRPVAGPGGSVQVRSLGNQCHHIQHASLPHTCLWRLLAARRGRHAHVYSPTDRSTGLIES